MWIVTGKAESRSVNTGTWSKHQRRSCSPQGGRFYGTIEFKRYFECFSISQDLKDFVSLGDGWCEATIWSVFEACFRLWVHTARNQTTEQRKDLYEWITILHGEMPILRHRSIWRKSSECWNVCTIPSLFLAMVCIHWMLTCFAEFN